MRQDPGREVLRAAVPSFGMGTSHVSPARRTQAAGDRQDKT